MDDASSFPPVAVFGEPSFAAIINETGHTEVHFLRVAQNP